MTNPFTTHLDQLQRLRSCLSDLDLPGIETQPFYNSSKAIISRVKAIEEAYARGKHESRFRWWLWFDFDLPTIPNIIQNKFYQDLKHSIIVCRLHFSQISRVKVEEWNSAMHGIVGKLITILSEEENQTLPKINQGERLLEILSGVQLEIDKSGGLYDWAAAQRALIAEASQALRNAASDWSQDHSIAAGDTIESRADNDSAEFNLSLAASEFKKEVGIWEDKTGLAMDTQTLQAIRESYRASLSIDTGANAGSSVSPVDTTDTQKAGKRRASIETQSERRESSRRRFESPNPSV